MKLIRFVLFLAITFLLLSSQQRTVYAQYCGGSVRCCSNYENVRTPRGCSTNCNEDDLDCVLCTGTDRRCASYAGSGACSSSGAGSGGPVCYDNCNGVIESGGCTAYYPPPPPPPPPSTPRPISTNIPSTPTTDPNEGNDVQEDPTLYTCDGCTGTCSVSAGGSTAAACSASCTPYLANTEYCIPPPNPGPVLISEPSCPELIETAVDDVIQPNETTTWTTWAAPEQNSAAARLESESPGATAKSFTSPGDKITFVSMFRVPEGQPHSFYLFDKKDQTFFFFVAKDKPPVIASRNQWVVDAAVEEGYTWITDTSVANAANAKTINKRVYKLPDDEEVHPWKNSSGNPLGIVSHLPWGESYTHIPWVNCASLFRASGHGDYYSTNIASLDGDDPYCFRRQILYENNSPAQWPHPDDPQNDELSISHVAGNYLGLENDIFATVAGPGYWGIDSSGDIIWPIMSALDGPRYNYFDNMQYAFMETKDRWLARPQTHNEHFTPAFMRQAVIQIPTRVVSEGNHYFRSYAGLGDPGNETPIPDENSSQGCETTNGGGKLVPVCHKPGGCNGGDSETPERINPKCEDFQIINASTGEAVSEGGKVKIGETYTIRANAKGNSWLFPFYNSSFNAPDITPAPIDNWSKTGGITTFEVVNCTSVGGGCRPEYEDTSVLRAARSNGSSADDSKIQTDFIDIQNNITNRTFQVEFWAKVDSATPRTVSSFLIERDHTTLPYPPYDTTGHWLDVRELRFPNTDTEDLNDTTNSITVTNQWRKYTGMVTFTYDTSNPTGHPNGNESTRLKISLKSPTSANIYYDDVTLITWKQPTVYYRMAPAIPGPTSGYDQCDLSIWQNGNTSTNLSGGHFWANITIPTTRPGTGDALPTGNYNIFAALDVKSNYVYFGNPNAVSNCNLNGSHWNDGIANPPLPTHEACMRTVEVVACNNTTPAVPIIASINGDTNNTLPNSGSFIEVDTTNDELVIVAQVRGNALARAAVTSMQMYVAPHGNRDHEDAQFISGVPSADGINYTFTYKPLDQDLTNELFIRITAINANACNENDQLTNQLERNIRLMRRRSGHLIEVPRDQINNASMCNQHSVGTSILNISDSKFNGTVMAANIAGVGGFNSITATIGNTNPYRTFTRSGSAYSMYLPYNPPNNLGWGNQIISAVLRLPEMPPTVEETYMCVDICNAKVASGSTAAWCSIPGERIPKAGATAYTNDLNVYVTTANLNDPWWQVRGGLVFAEGSIISNLPIFNNNPRTICGDHRTDDVCQPYINAKRLNLNTGADAHDSAGIVISDSNNVSAPGSYITQRTSNSNQAVENASTATNQENYDYFRALVKEGTKIKRDLPSPLTSKPTGAEDYDPDPNENVRVYEAPSSLNIDLRGGNTIEVTGNEKIIVFVPGTLTIGGDANANMVNKITVAPGSFLAFIVRDNIIFQSSVGTSVVTEKQPAIEGMYIAGGTLTIQSDENEATSDKKFIGRGSFIGLGSVELLREFNSTSNPFDEEKNSYSPVEQFIFSPSLVAATPNLLRSADLTWQETN